MLSGAQMLFNSKRICQLINAYMKAVAMPNYNNYATQTVLSFDNKASRQVINVYMRTVAMPNYSNYAMQAMLSRQKF